MAKKEFKEMFINGLQSIYYVEMHIVEALPTMLQAAQSKELKEAFRAHLEETNHQVGRLNKIFKALGVKNEEATCEAIDGMIAMGEKVINMYPLSPLRDAALICAAQCIEHYEMAVYGSLCTWARELQLEEISNLLNQTLKEEGNANKSLTHLAEGGFFSAGINQQALQ
jgi:ferritin-like metal-binding protein YciE